jgi:pyrroloquinoline quinone biosynthesis protein D
MEDLLSTKPQLIRNCRLSNTPEQGAMLLMPEGVIRLKGTGLAILEQCNGERTLDEIIVHLVSQFAGTTREQIETEVIPFLKGLREKRVVDFK